MPLYPLDGGRILKSILCLIKGRKRAESLINKISNIMFFLMMFIFSILIYYLKNISILNIMLYLLYIDTKENKIYKMKMKMYEIIDENWKRTTELLIFRYLANGDASLRVSAGKLDIMILQKDL